MNMVDLYEELRIQESIEGITEELKLVKRVLPLIVWNSELSCLCDVKFHRYGKLSYQQHRFWYPSRLLKNLEILFI